MPTAGNSSTPSYAAQWAGINTQPYQVAGYFFFPGGNITSISCYFAGWQNPVTAALCIWDASGNLIFNTSTFSVPTGTTSPGGQFWNTSSGFNFNPYGGNTGGNIYIGWWRSSAQRHVWSFTNSGTFYGSTDAGGSPGSINSSQTSTSPGTPGAYVTYNSVLSGVQIWNGSSFVTKPTSIWNGSAFVTKPIYIWNGSAWVQKG